MPAQVGWLDHSLSIAFVCEPRGQVWVPSATLKKEDKTRAEYIQFFWGQFPHLAHISSKIFWTQSYLDKCSPTILSLTGCLVVLTWRQRWWKCWLKTYAQISLELWCLHSQTMKWKQTDWKVSEFFKRIILPTISESWYVKPNRSTSKIPSGRKSTKVWDV